MSNMSYCRFENTLSDLLDCEEALEEAGTELSESEERARRELIEACKRIVDDYWEAS